MDINFMLPHEVEFITEMIEKSGFEAYVVGGCVRDMILDRLPHDWDICTSANPDEIIKLFEKHHVIETGLKHGTVTIMLNHNQYEITTYRIDGNYSDNRRPDNVEFTRNLKEDLTRRDFTINAMAYNPKTGLVDLFHGMSDIQDKMVRCVSDANERFREDALRILRAMRFSIQLGFEISDDTYDAMISNKTLIRNVSFERISSELIKMLQSNNSIQRYFQKYRDIIAEFIAEFIPCFDFSQNNPYHKYDVYNHILYAVDKYSGDDMIVKLSLLLHDIGKPGCYFEDEKGGHFHGHGGPGSDMAKNILKRLRFDKQTVKAVTELVLYHDATISATPKAVKKWLNKVGEVQFRRLLEIRTADIMAQSNISRESRLQKQMKLKELLEEIISEEQCFSIKDLAVNGNDLMGIGYKQGKQLGCSLNRLLDCVIANEVCNNKTELLQLAERWILNGF